MQRAWVLLHHAVRLFSIIELFCHIITLHKPTLQRQIEHLLTLAQRRVEWLIQWSRSSEGLSVGGELTVATTTAVHIFLTQIRCSPQLSAALPTLLVGLCAETGPRVRCPLQRWQQRWSKMDRFQCRGTSKGLWSILCGCGQVTTPCVEFFGTAERATKG